MSKIINSTQKDFEENVLRSEKPALVDFWAPWCGPCIYMGPILEELSEEISDKLRIVKVNVDDPANAELAGKYDIRSIPNMKIFKKGQVISEIIGAREKEELLAEINSTIG